MSICSGNRIDEGEYSSGTLKDEHLGDMFATMAAIADCDRWRDLVAELETFLEESDAGMFVGADIDETMNELFDHADNHAPIGHWFGSHEGDGASFGYWQEEESE